ncbi:ATP--guanido phosphotransferase [Gracilinema caldarium]|uniref:ATP:guanido phosphotransferase, catalytic domain protein n=1 Tax=Gracilinema caldarium (strain ATCC 51460 / DSM 7334 / H1) TaxID=744872 RepID=F8F1Q4_GRAC1|nr:ATP--guanido phosphotransferase [Gracilinema caldarium]AEJ19388.1 ATP:guanido phosphotransferase, catalytic domain protein [Gracilinema caldarium DSM 7334]
MNTTYLDPWFWFNDNPDLDCVVYCRLGLYRALSGELFPHRCSNEDLERIQNKIILILNELIGNKLLLITSENLGDSLTSAQEIFDDSDLILLQNGQTLVLGPKGMLFLINKNSHVFFSQIGPGFLALDSFQELLTLDETLDTELTWACSETYGFLNPDPIHTGSGLECRALLFMPGTIESGMFERAVKSLISQGFELSLYQGEQSAEDSARTETSFPLVYLRYSVSPGMSEQDGLEQIRNALNGLIKGERATRERLVQKLSDEILDKANRAFGILTHAHLLSRDECRKLLLDLRKGLVYNCISFQGNQGLLADIDRLWFSTETLVRQRLAIVPEQQITDNYVQSLRAKLVRSVLSQYHIERGM